MGLLSRSTGFVRYAVEGELPENFWDFAAEQVARCSFKDIDDTFDEYSAGWVSTLNMFDSSFTYNSFALGDYLVMALRVDERKVAPGVLNKFVMKEEERIKKEKEVPKLSRNHRLEIKENVRLKLVKLAVPMASVYDICWNLADGTLMFFSSSRKAQSIFEDFFKDCFGMVPILQVPYLAAEYMLDSKGLEALADLRPAIFV